jgi:hypothetical protein
VEAVQIRDGVEDEKYRERESEGSTATGTSRGYGVGELESVGARDQREKQNDS